MNPRDNAVSRPDVDLDAPCWLWTGSLHEDGYGELNRGGKTLKAHRFIWIALRGEIPQGLEIDHLCRVRSCVNPLHMELVTHQENVLRGQAPSAVHARKTECPQGHPYTPENTRVWSNGKRRGRSCRACERERSRTRVRT